MCCAGIQVPRLAALARAAGRLTRPDRRAGLAAAGWRLADAAGPIPLVPWAEPGAAAPGLVVQAGPVAPSGPVRIVHAPQVSLRPHAGGLVHLEAPDAAVDLHTPDEELRRWAGELLDRARRVTGGLDGATVTGYRVCVRPMPADGRSIVGWLPGVEGVYVAVTHSGVTLGAHLAGLITAEVLGGAGGMAPAELAPFRPGRFTAGSPRPSAR